ncbi:thioredoxin family protein [Cytobacillus spongiae]|jgi:thiol-disulfide isomerase/thioredoxin|uniref:thioredoxin family protein n=1 Tax=Cytobacillus spongiae TaxID=2901381 RepID=UPI001F15C5F5|nr:thioredoxin family protein [Cytobacillus spongiae]UII55452.1 thioredoxin family protein [Cytobacillus spongiae]
MQEWIPNDFSENIAKAEITFLYMYTPLCGTCQMAGKMLQVVTELLPNQNWGKINLNYIPDHSESWEVESVPCLAVFKSGELIEKIYAFHSVPYLLDKLKSIE